MRSALLLPCLVAVACGPKPAPSPGPSLPDPGTAKVEPAPPVPPPPPRARAIETPALVATPLPNDPMKVTIHRLRNGMTVYLCTDRQKPSVSAHIAVRAGSRHDPQNSTGLAHYLEHMLFKGTTTFGTLDYAKEKPHLDRIAQLYNDLRVPGADAKKILTEIDRETQESGKYAIPNELDNLYARIGITGLNAFTAEDATVYIAEVPRNRLAQWARIEGTRYQDAVFRLFWPELEAVYEEKNRSLDNAAWRIEETMLKGLFPKHGYGYSSGIGEVEHLKKPAYGDMVTFFNRYYSPGNMAILLAGDVDASILSVLEKEFAGFTRPAGEAVEPGEIAPPRGRTPLTVQVPSDEGVILAWPAMPANHPDRIVFELMDMLLLDGESGIISRDLLLPQKVANAGSGAEFHREAGWFRIYGDALKGQTHDQIEQLLLEVIGKLQRGEFTDQDIATAILQYQLRTDLQLESNDGRLAMMEEAFITGYDWASRVTFVERMKKLTKADVVRVAKQYLTPNMLVVKKVKGAVSPPKIDKPQITAVALDPNKRSRYAETVMAMTIDPIEPVAIREGTDYERFILPTGPMVSVKNNRNQLFAINYEFDFGRSDDRLACLALDVLKVSGAGKRTPEQVERALHELGISINSGCSKDETSISISGIDKNMEAGLTILREWLADPAFDDQILKASVASALTERANLVDSPQGIAGAAAQFARVGKESELLVVPTNKQLEAAKPAELKKILARFLAMKNHTQYFGPRSGGDAAKLIALGKGTTATRPPKRYSYRAPNTSLVVDQDTAQTHVWMMWPRAPVNDNERALGTLFSEYAGPVLYQEVREARGLAYTVRGGFSPGGRKGDASALYAYVGTQGNKTHDAIAGVLGTLKMPVDDNRLAIAKETLTQNYRVDRIEPRAIASVVFAWDDQGVKGDPRAERTKRALDVSKADLEKWIKSAIAGPSIVSITGKKGELDPAKLKVLPPVTDVPKDKLFGF